MPCERSSVAAGLRGSAMALKTDIGADLLGVPVRPLADKHVSATLSHPAPHPRDVVVISRAELAAHLGFLEGDVDPIDSGEDGEGRHEHWPGADPYGDA